jgi:alcohol dehydrogenase class IV
MVAISEVAPFEFATAQQIIFGEGKANTLLQHAKGLGTRAFVVTGSSHARVLTLFDSNEAQAFIGARHTVRGEPSVADALSATDAARMAQCDVIVAVGGGSVIDTGKAVAALLTNGGNPLDYLEVVGRGQPLRIASAPLIAAPTTAGTGAEVTRNAVLAVPEQRVKVSLRSSTMLPRIALVDPELTLSMSPEVTASTGLDALTQCIEPFVSNAANPLSDGAAREGVMAAARGLRRAYADGTDRGARQLVAMASLCGGLALANAKLGAVHGFAGVIGGMFPAPHGAICACLLPHVMVANVAALIAHNPESATRARFDQLAYLLTGDPRATAHEGVAWVQSLCADLNITPLHYYGVERAHFDEIVAKSKSASSMKGNPIALSDQELHGILAAAL